MRTGLLAVGAAMAIVGASVVLAVTMPIVPPTTAKTDHSWQAPVPGDNWLPHDLLVTPAGSASMTFTWNASSAVSVSWYAIGPCSNAHPVLVASGQSWCIEGQKIMNWTNLSSGSWSQVGNPYDGYCVLVDNPGAAPVNFSSDLIESYHVTSNRLPVLETVLVIAGGALLAGIGGVAMYLGLFLPAGVYADDEDDLDPIPDAPRPPNDH